MRPLRIALALFLAGGVVFGYGSGIVSLVHGHGFSMDELLKVKKLANELGGTAKLKELATALAKLV